MTLAVYVYFWDSTYIYVLHASQWFYISSFFCPPLGLRLVSAQIQLVINTPAKNRLQTRNAYMLISKCMFVYISVTVFNSPTKPCFQVRKETNNLCAKFKHHVCLAVTLKTKMKGKISQFHSEVRSR